METKGKFPSSEMVHKLAKALGIDPTELFYKKIDPVTAMKDSQKAAVEDLGESVVRLIKVFFDEKVRELEAETGENDQSAEKQS
jgi:hypothetical protein